MTVRLRKYQPDLDFLRIRDFLVEAGPAFDKPLNWDLCRWNYARYFVAPLFGVWLYAGEQEGIRFLEDTIGVWENEAGEIVGVVHAENPEHGEAFFQRHPRYAFLLAEMLDYAETTFANRKEHTLRVHVYDYDAPFQALVQGRGYRKDTEYPRADSEFVIGDLPRPNLPPGYAVRSMAQENDIERRRKVLGLGFDHPDPSGWATVATYEELQQAPDYRKDLDLYVVGPDGEYVSCCVIWYDERNRMGTLEPVCTHPDYRRQGFGREVVLEGIRRIAALGARKVRVGSGQPFYEAIGFRKAYTNYNWTKTS